MEITNLLSYAWIQGLLILVLFRATVVLLRIFFKSTTKNGDISKKDSIIEFFVLIFSFGVPFVAQFLFNVPNVFWYTLVFAILGMIFEFLFDFIWLKLMGTRLYRYYKANILGFTSWYVFPYWACAGLFFYGMWQFILYLSKKNIVLNIDITNLIKDMAVVGVATFFIVLFVIAFKDYLNGRLSNTSGFKWSKYLLLVLSVTLPVIYFIIAVGNELVLLYFLFSTIIGLVMEGLLSRLLKRLHGESFWLYSRYGLFKQGTSLLILPIWALAALLAFIVFNSMGLQ